MTRRREPDLHAGSLLDRLVARPDGRDGALGMSALKEGLRRDLEDLLNTRRPFISPPAELTELERSLLTYGLSDFTHEQINSLGFRQDFVDEVERVLRNCEPRVQVHEVRVLDNADPLDRRLRFRITGAAMLAGERQALSLDSWVDPVEGAIVVGD